MPPRFTAEMLAGGETIALNILDFIGEDFWSGDGITDKLVHRALRDAPGAKLIKITMNSPGGDAFMGITIANLLRAHGARKELDVLGMCASAATLIALACDDVRMGTGSQMMIHEASGGRRGKAADFRAAAQELQNLTDSAIDAYAARTKKPRDEMAKLVADETWFSAQQAVDIGLADGLIDRPKSAAAKAMASLGPSLRAMEFRNLPADVVAMMASAVEQAPPRTFNSLGY